jgi:hypothetical protein
MAGRKSPRESAQIAALTRRATVLVTAFGAALALSACGEKSEPDLAQLPPPPPTTTSTSTGSTTSTPTPPDRSAVVIERYIQAINTRDGAAICTRMVPGSIAQITLPKRKDNCAQSLSASIGYHEANGPPTLTGVKLRKAVIGASADQAIATLAPTFEGQQRTLITREKVYLVKVKRRWLIAKPSPILYRAVGQRPPASASRPPRP